MPASPDEPFGCEVGATCPLEQHLPWSRGELVDHLSPGSRAAFEDREASIARLRRDIDATGRDVAALTIKKLEAQAEGYEATAKARREEVAGLPADDPRAALLEPDIVKAELLRHEAEDRIIAILEEHASNLFPEHDRTLVEESDARWTASIKRTGTTWYRGVEPRRPSGGVAARFMDRCWARIAPAIESGDGRAREELRHSMRDQLGPLGMASFMVDLEEKRLRSIESPLSRLSERTRRFAFPLYFRFRADIGADGNLHLHLSRERNPLHRAGSGRRRSTLFSRRRSGARRRASRGRPIRTRGSRRITGRSAGGGSSGDGSSGSDDGPALGRLYCFTPDTLRVAGRGTTAAVAA